MYGYYQFLARYGREPVDEDDFFDGLRNVAADNAVMEVLTTRG